MGLLSSQSRAPGRGSLCWCQQDWPSTQAQFQIRAWENMTLSQKYSCKIPYIIHKVKHKYINRGRTVKYVVPRTHAKYDFHSTFIIKSFLSSYPLSLKNSSHKLKSTGDEMALKRVMPSIEFSFLQQIQNQGPSGWYTECFSMKSELCLTSLNMTIFRSIHVAATWYRFVLFWWLSDIPFYICTLPSLSIPLWMDI